MFGFNNAKTFCLPRLRLSWPTWILQYSLNRCFYLWSIFKSIFRICKFKLPLWNQNIQVGPTWRSSPMYLKIGSLIGKNRLPWKLIISKYLQVNFLNLQLHRLSFRITKLTTRVVLKVRKFICKSSTWANFIRSNNHSGHPSDIQILKVDLPIPKNNLQINDIHLRTWARQFHKNLFTVQYFINKLSFDRR